MSQKYLFKISIEINTIEMRTVANERILQSWEKLVVARISSSLSSISRDQSCLPAKNGGKLERAKDTTGGLNKFLV